MLPQPSSVGRCTVQRFSEVNGHGTAEVHFDSRKATSVLKPICIPVSILTLRIPVWTSDKGRPIQNPVLIPPLHPKCTTTAPPEEATPIQSISSEEQLRSARHDFLPLLPSWERLHLCISLRHSAVERAATSGIAVHTSFVCVPAGHCFGGVCLSAVASGWLWPSPAFLRCCTLPVHLPAHPNRMLCRQ